MCWSLVTSSVSAPALITQADLRQDRHPRRAHQRAGRAAWPPLAHNVRTQAGWDWALMAECGIHGQPLTLQILAEDTLSCIFLNGSVALLGMLRILFANATWYQPPEAEKASRNEPWGHTVITFPALFGQASNPFITLTTCQMHVQPPTSLVSLRALVSAFSHSRRAASGQARPPHSRNQPPRVGPCQGGTSVGRNSRGWVPNPVPCSVDRFSQFLPMKKKHEKP